MGATTYKSSVGWGFGSAPLLVSATTEETETLVSLSDIHFPYADTALVDSALRLIKKLKPHNVVLNGDVNDFFQLSRFNTGLHRMDDLQDEIDMGNDFRAAVRKAVPNARIMENLGNHDSRIISYVEQNARALKSLRALDPEHLFEYVKHEILSFPGAGFRIRPEFLIKHGTIVRGAAGASAKGEMEKAGISGISGHTHRLAPFRKSGYSNRVWWEQGCLCRLDPEYVVGPPDWVNGIVVCQFSTSSSAFLVEPAEAVGDHLVYGGKKF